MSEIDEDIKYEFEDPTMWNPVTTVKGTYKDWIIKGESDPCEGCTSIDFYLKENGIETEKGGFYLSLRTHPKCHIYSKHSMRWVCDPEPIINELFHSFLTSYERE